MKISSRILLCIMGELTGVGFVAVAVGVSYIRQVIDDTRNMTHDTVHLTCDTFFFSPYFLAHVTRFSVLCTGYSLGGQNLFHGYLLIITKN